MKLVFLHGFSGQPSDWDACLDTLTPLLSEQAMDYVIFQTPILDFVPLEQPHILIGYSMGARIALQTACADATACKGLVFIGGNPGLETDVPARIDWEENWLQQLEAEVTNASAETFINAWYGQPLFANSDPAILQALKQEKRAGDIAQWREQFARFALSKQPNLWPKLGDLSIPVLAIAGSRDSKYVEIMSRMATLLPRAEARFIPDCGHMVPREQPHALAKAIANFLK